MRSFTHMKGDTHMSWTVRRAVGIGTAALVACLAAACSNAGTSSEATSTTPSASESATQELSESRDKLVLIAADDPGTLDYVTSNLTALALWIPDNVIEPLLILGQDGDLTPGLAETWDVDDAQTTYTFHLRDASFSDGSPVTAADVVYSMNAMKDSPVGLNKGPYAAVEDIVADDDKTVTVTLSRPSRAFIEGMASIAGSVQPEAAAGSIETKPVGTGPYKVKEYVPDNHLVFEANPNYWGDKPAISEIEVRFVNDGTSALNALKAGEADGYPYLGQELWERMTKEGLDTSMALETYPQGGSVFFLNFNSTQSPSDNVDFRRALVKSMDRQQFVDLFNAPWGIVPTCDLVGPDKASMDGCVDTYDVEAAKAQLAASGVGDTPVELTSVTDIGNLVGPSDLAVSFFEAAGADVTRTQLDLARFSQVVFSGDPPQYGVTVMTTEYNLTQMASCPDPAKVGWKTYCDADITKMLEDADRATSEEERDELLAAAQQKLQEDAVIVPIMASKGAGLLSKDLKGWTAPRVVVAIHLASLHW